MTLKIAQLGQPVLRKVAEEVAPAEIATPQFQQLVQDMLDTLTEAQGAGLAAPQVFRSQRLFVAAVLPSLTEDGPRGAEVFINPRLVAAWGEPLYSWEGCLSFPELLVLVPRQRCVRVAYLNRNGQPGTLDLQDFLARVVQHEYDHLEGVLTLDRAPSTRHIVKASEIESVLAEEEDA